MNTRIPILALVMLATLLCVAEAGASIRWVSSLGLVLVQHVFNCFAFAEPILYGSITYFQTVGPLAEAQRFSLVLYPVIITLVVALFFSRCPSAIVFAIRAVIVNAIDRMKWAWAKPHISKKLLERLPFYGYSSTVVVTEGLVVCVRTSVSHATENSPFGSTFPAMSQVHSPADFLIQATAALCSASQLTTENDRNVPAVTLTHPSSSALSIISCSFDDNQSPKPLPDQINKIRAAHESPPGGVLDWSARRARPGNRASGMTLAAQLIYLFLPKFAIMSILIAGIVLLTLPGQAFGLIRWVSKSGSDANSCAAIVSATEPGNLATGSRLTINAGLTCLAAADTLTIKAGTYVESFNSTVVPSGTSVSARTIIKGAPGESVIIRPSTGNAVYGDVMTFSNRRYITISNLDFDGDNVANVIIGFTDSSDNIRVENSKFHATPASDCIAATRNQSTDRPHFQILNNEIYNCQSHGVYMRAHDNTVEYNYIHDLVLHISYGIRLDSPEVGNRIMPNNIIRFNRVKTTQNGGIQCCGGPGGIVNNNTVEDAGNSVTVAGIYIALGFTDAAQVYNNTIYNNTGACVWLRVGDNHIVKNNICRLNSDNTIKIDPGVIVTATNNLFTDPSFVNAATGDFGLQAGSAAIDAGTVIAGGPTQSCAGCYNGTAPDIGAHETLTFVAGNCTIPDTANDNQQVINFTGNVAAFSPLYPASCAGFTGKKNGVGNTVTGCVASNYQVTLTFTNAYVNGDTGSFQYAPGTLTDGADIGRGNGTLGSGKNQRLNAIASDQSCTNLIGAASVATLDQVDWRFERWGGSSESGSDGNFSSQAAVTTWAGGQFRFRTAIKNTGSGNKAGQGYTVRANLDGGAYGVIPNCPASPACLDGTGELIASATTNQLTCATFVAGGVQLSSAAAPNVALNAGQCTELLFGLRTDSALAVGQVICFRPYQADGSPLDTYNGSPDACVTIGATKSSSTGGAISGGARQ